MPDSSRYLEIGDSAEEFADCIIRLLQDPKRRQRLALEGLNFLSKYYSYSVVVRDFGRDVPEVLQLLSRQGMLKRRFWPTSGRHSPQTQSHIGVTL
jgi:hypothetical protein